MKSFNAKSLDLRHFHPIDVSYQPRDIYTQAIQVTPDNIGALSLEFEEELHYDSHGNPYFMFTADREDKNEEHCECFAELYVRLSNWIVILWGQLHVWQNQIFEVTFKVDDRVDVAAMTEYAMRDALATAETFGQNIAWEEAEDEWHRRNENRDVTQLRPPAPDFRTKTGMKVQYKPLLPHFEFNVDDRVRIGGEPTSFGKVVVVNVEMGDGRQGVEVELDKDGFKQVFPAEQLTKTTIQEYVPEIDDVTSEGDGY